MMHPWSSKWITATTWMMKAQPMIGFEDPMGVRTFVITFEPFSQFQKFIPHFKALFNAHQMRRLDKGADGYLRSR